MLKPLCLHGQGVKLYAWDEFMAMGERKPAEPVPPKADDIATIMYTSGTTGAPEPVCLHVAPCSCP